MNGQREYPVLILEKKPGFRVLFTPHAGQRLHARKPELWDEARWEVNREFRLNLAFIGCVLQMLNVRGECKLITNDLRVVYDMSNTAARIVTVMTMDEMPESAASVQCKRWEWK